jgi:hypothetical protein
VDQDPISLLDVIGLPDQGQRRETLQIRGDRELGGQSVRDRDGGFGGYGGVLGVTTGVHPDDAGANVERVVVRCGGDGDDGAASFASEDLWLGRWVETGAEVAVDG